MKHPDKFSLLDCKITVAKNLIQYHQGQKMAVPMSRPSKTKNKPESIYNHGGIYQITKHCESDGRNVQ